MWESCFLTQSSRYRKTNVKSRSWLIQHRSPASVINSESGGSGLCPEEKASPRTSWGEAELSTFQWLQWNSLRFLMLIKPEEMPLNHYDFSVQPDSYVTHSDTHLSSTITSPQPVHKDRHAVFGWYHWVEELNLLPAHSFVPEKKPIYHLITNTKPTGIRDS